MDNDFNLDKMLPDLQEKYGAKITVSRDSFFNWITVQPPDLLALMAELKAYGFNYLANLAAVDYGDSFEVVYHFYSIPDNHKIGIKSRISRNSPHLPSITSLWPTADWQEREAYDLLGVIFDGHPNLIRVLLPEEFVGHPLRKDFKKEG